MPEVDSKTIFVVEGVDQSAIIDQPGKYGVNLSAIASARSADAASDVNTISMTAPPAGGTIGGTTVSPNEIVVMLNLDTPALRGPWRIGTPWTRPAWFATGSVQRAGQQIYVQRGDRAEKYYRLKSPDPATVGTSALVWEELPQGHVIKVGGSTTPPATTINYTGAITAQHSTESPGGQLDLNFTSEAATTLDALEDVQITGNPTQGELLGFDGVTWTNLAGDQSSFSGFSTGYLPLASPAGTATNGTQPVPSTGQDNYFTAESYARTFADLTHVTEVALVLRRGNITVNGTDPRVRAIWSADGTNWYGFDGTAIGTMPTATVTPVLPSISMNPQNTTIDSGWVQIPPNLSPSPKGRVHVKAIWEGGDGTQVNATFGKLFLHCKVPIPTSPPATQTPFEKYIGWNGALVVDDSEMAPTFGIDGTITEITSTLQAASTTGGITFELWRTQGHSQATMDSTRALVFSGTMGQGVFRKTNTFATPIAVTKMDRFYIRIPTGGAGVAATDLSLTLIGRRNS